VSQRHSVVGSLFRRFSLLMGLVLHHQQDDLPPLVMQTVYLMPSGCIQDKHPFHVPGHGHQAPLAADLFEATQ